MSEEITLDSLVGEHVLSGVDFGTAERGVEEQIKRFGGLMLPDEFANKLDYDSFAVEKRA